MVDDTCVYAQAAANMRCAIPPTFQADALAETSFNPAPGCCLLARHGQIAQVVQALAHMLLLQHEFAAGIP